VPFAFFLIYGSTTTFKSAINISGSIEGLSAAEDKKCKSFQRYFAINLEILTTFTMSVEEF
jgi:hypothetical protein